MINLLANERLKRLGCKWEKNEWIAPKLAQKEAQQVKDKFYSNLIVIEVELKNGNNFTGNNWGYSHVRTIGGYIIASAKGRDSGAIIFDGIAVIKGKFESGGSVKNYRCHHSDDMILRLEVAQDALEFIDKEVLEERYTYKIIGE